MFGKMKNSGVALKLAAILLCLVVCSTCLLSRQYARYTVSAGAHDSARVASFVIDTDINHIELGTDGTPMLELGGESETQSVQLPFYISNGSEVAVGYTIKIDFDCALPEYLTLTVTGNAKSQTLYADGSKSEFEFSNFGTLAPGAFEAQRADLVLTISVSDVSLITEVVSIPTAELTVKVFQID